MSIDDTIAAIATAEGESGVGIIRISGEKALIIGKSVFSPKTKTASYEHGKFYYGTVVNQNDFVIDDVLFVYMKKPNSYTGEDTVEIHCHGNTIILKKTLELVINNGGRLAEPGEFTKRAFLNGKMDLSQAEAVSDLIAAKTDAALKCARGRLEGALSKKITFLKDKILDVVSEIEAGLDFAEEEDVGGFDKKKLAGKIQLAGDEIKTLLISYEEGRILKEGIKVVILGRPNAGKSSLLNLLLKEERAIVTEEPGTTRDIIEEIISVRGYCVRLIDTAGLRDTISNAESKGIELARKKANESDFILYVIDGKEEDLTADEKILDAFARSEVKTVIAINKIDAVKNRAIIIDRAKKFFPKIPLICISAKNGENLKGLEDALCEKIIGRQGPIAEREAGELVTSVREKEAIARALDAVEMALESVEKDRPLELAASDLKQAMRFLGEITGETTSEDVLNRIFERFCIGK